MLNYAVKLNDHIFEASHKYANQLIFHANNLAILEFLPMAISSGH